MKFTIRYLLELFKSRHVRLTVIAAVLGGYGAMHLDLNVMAHYFF